MNKKLLAVPALILVMTAVGIGLSTKASAASLPTTKQRPVAMGTVTAINGDTLTIQSKAFGKNKTTTPSTTYTVDATSATVVKDKTTSDLAAITVGDHVKVQGTLSGTTVTATKINDGVMMKKQGTRGVRGTVTAINGDTLTVQSTGFKKNATATTYTVNATSATVTKDKLTSSLSAIAIGDTVGVKGTITGTSIAATKINDGVMIRTKTTS
jgi:ribosomal protein L19